MLPAKFLQTRFSVARAVESLLSTRKLDGFEKECSEEIFYQTDRRPHGFYVPLDASIRADLTTGTGGGAIPTRLMPTLIGTLRARSIIGSLGGQFVGLENPDMTTEPTKIPRAAAGSIVSFVSQGTAQPTPVLSTTLTADATDTATTITVASVAGLPVNNGVFSVKIESEVLLVTAVDPVAKVLTVRRGSFGTIAAAHANGTAVSTMGILIDQVSYTPRTVSAVIDLTRKQLKSAGPGFIDMVVADLAGAIAAEIDRAALSSDGSGEEPTGMVEDPRIPIAASLGANGGPPTRAALIATEKAVGLANGDAAASPALGWATSPAGRAKLRSTFQVGSTFPKYLWNDENEILGYPAAASCNVTANRTKGSGTGLTALIFGDWTNATIGTWRALDILVNEFYASGMIVRISAFLEFDFALRQPSAFAKLTDLDPS